VLATATPQRRTAGRSDRTWSSAESSVTLWLTARLGPRGGRRSSRILDSRRPVEHSLSDGLPFWPVREAAMRTGGFG